jgi:hypothetical protein
MITNLCPIVYLWEQKPVSAQMYTGSALNVLVSK